MPAPAQSVSRSSQPATANALASHRAAQERHFVRRVKERFGLRVSAARYREFCRRIMEVDEHFGVKLLARDSDNPDRMHWAVKFGGYPMRVIFDEKTERLVTCMAFREERSFDFTRDHRAKLIRVRSVRKKRKTVGNAPAEI